MTDTMTNATFLNNTTKNISLSKKEPFDSMFVKINDEYKFIRSNNEITIKSALTTLYPNSETEIFTFSINSIQPLFNDLTKNFFNDNGFVTNYEFEHIEFINNIKKITEPYSYFLNIKKIEMHLSNTKKEESKINELFGYYSTFQSTGMIKMDKQNYDIRNTQIITNENPELDSFNSKMKNDNIDAYINDISFFNVDDFDKNFLNDTSKYTVLFNNQFNNLIIVKTKSIDDLTYFKEFVILTDNIDSKQYEEIKHLEKEIFVNADDAKAKLNRLINDKVIDTKLSIDEIKGLLSKYFEIDDNVEHKIKFTNICEIIFSEITVSNAYVNYIKRQLPIIFSDLGLQKKRLSDGMYWYGLVKKQENKSEFVPTVIENGLPQEKYDEKLELIITRRKKQEDELKEIMVNNTIY